MRVETFINAAVAGLLSFFNAMLALLNQEGVNALSDITEAALLSAAIGGAVALLQNWQTLSGRRAVARMLGKKDPYPHEDR